MTIYCSALKQPSHSELRDGGSPPFTKSKRNKRTKLDKKRKLTDSGDG